MIRCTKLVAATTVLIAALVIAGNVQAKLFRAQDPVPEINESVVAPAPAQAVAAECTDCCAPKYCIVYRKHLARRKVCCGCCVEPYTAMLKVTDPCSCCPVEVPVCVPGCCTDAPTVNCRRGLFGRTITDYTWCCGYNVPIVLTRRNTIVVHTYGS